MNKLQRAMQAVVERGDVAEMERTALDLGEEAVRIALCEQPGEPSDRAKLAEMERQRDLDAALADAIEIVARHRARSGRKVCSRHDGETVRKVFELLRGMLESGADNDPSFS